MLYIAISRQNIDASSAFSSQSTGPKADPANIRSMRDVIAHCILPKALTTPGGDVMSEICAKIAIALEKNPNVDDLIKV